MQQRDLVVLDRVQGVVLLEEAGKAARSELQSDPGGDQARTNGAASSAESATARYLLPSMVAVRVLMCVRDRNKGPNSIIVEPGAGIWHCTYYLGANPPIFFLVPELTLLTVRWRNRW